MSEAQAPTKNVTCKECGRPHPLEEALQERPVEGFATAREVGLECPHCESWTHSYFLNARLDSLRATLQKRKGGLKERKDGKLIGSAVALKRYKKAKKRYQREFDRFNAWLREQLGVQAPSEIRAAAGAPDNSG